MTVQINYKNSSLKTNTANLILFVDEKFNINNLKKYLSNLEFSYISDLLKNSDLKKDLLFFEVNSKKTVFLVSVKKDVKISDTTTKIMIDRGKIGGGILDVGRTLRLYYSNNGSTTI